MANGQLPACLNITYFLLEDFFFLCFDLLFFFDDISLTTALAAANLAIGTRNGEQLT
jgi:hypothetical protein